MLGECDVMAHDDQLYYITSFTDFSKHYYYNSYTVERFHKVG